MHLVLDTCIDVFTKVANDRRCHATVAAFIAYATPFDLPSFGRGATSERESTERGTMSD
jgi:hypothetical protein